MSRFVWPLLVLAVLSPLALANFMIIRVVIESGPPDGAKPPDAPPAPPGEGAPADPAASPEAQAAPPIGDPARSVVVMVPVTSKLDFKREFDKTKSRHPILNPEWEPTINHRFASPSGVTFLFSDGASIFLHPIPGTLREKEILDRYTEWQTKKQGPAELHDLAFQALAAGMTKEAVAYSDKLLSLVQGKKDVSPALQHFAKAYAEVGPKLQSPAPQPADADFWRDQLAAFPNANVQKYMHYALVYWEDSDKEVNRRLQMLEENLKHFYLWHALRGEALKVPEKPLPVILARDGRDIPMLYRALDGTSISTDAFFAADHGVLVLSPHRLDPVGQAFRAMMRPVYGKNDSNVDLLLKGQGPQISETVKAGDVARLTTLALVDRALQQDAELAAISREGTRQILFALGALPSHVTLPRWLENGYGAVYEHARVPVFTGRDTETPKMIFAANRGTGSAHFAMLHHYRGFLESGELDTDPGARLLKVINDGYFQAIRSGVDLDPKKGPVRPKVPDPKRDLVKEQAQLTEKITNKAHATAWALLYFLTRERPQELLQFGQELGRLPHDLPLDPATLRLAFGRAFKLLDKDGQAIDPDALKSLGKAWDDFMITVRQPTFDVAIARPKKPTTPMPGDPTQPPPSRPSDP